MSGPHCAPRKKRLRAGRADVRLLLPAPPVKRGTLSKKRLRLERLGAYWWIARTALQTRCTPTQWGHNCREGRPCSLTPFLEARGENQCAEYTICFVAIIRGDTHSCLCEALEWNVSSMEKEKLGRRMGIFIRVKAHRRSHGHHRCANTPPPAQGSTRESACKHCG